MVQDLARLYRLRRKVARSATQLLAGAPSHTMRMLLRVEDTFMIRGRGLIVVPAPAIDEVRGPGDVDTELRLPDGRAGTATLTLSYEFVTPTPTVHRWNCLFKSLGKGEVPIGTEVWCEDDLFLAPKRGAG